MFPKASIFLFLAASQFLLRSVSSVDFVYNTNFTSTNTLLFGATVDSPSSILTLTNQTARSIGRGLFPSRISVSSSSSASPLPFATSFIFSIAPYKNMLPGHGFAFVFLPSSATSAASSAQHLGIVNFTNNGDPNNRIFAVEFDVFANQEFNDINDNHVGVDVNSLTSVSSAVAGFWQGERFKELRLNNGDNYQTWIEFNVSAINVTMARAGSRKPVRPLISIPLNLTGVLVDDMFVGFTAATGQLVQSHRILSWSFSNSNFSIGDALITENLPSFKLQDDSVLKSKGFIAGVSVGAFVLIVSVLGLLFYVVRRPRRRVEEDVEDWETEYWPHRVKYRNVLDATKGFSEENMIGYGGNSKVYRGVLEGREVAVKRIMISPRESVAGTSEFLAEVSSLGRLRHKNIVGLRGWCKKGGESLILVYEYMENGSVDKRMFDCNHEMLSWEERMRVIRDVASGMLYLHEGWESKVLHRDIKSSNVLLDKDMNARVGDFGLAKLQNAMKEMVSTTHVVGTAGYMAPELVKTGRASAETDVYSFGVFVLEVVCGRRPIEEGREGIVEWMWGLMEKDKVVDGLDERIKEKGSFEVERVEMALRLGMFCVHHDPKVRPTTRQVVQILEQGRLSDDGDEREREGMEVSLLERMKSSYLLGTSEGRQQQEQHPTFQDVWNTYSHSKSFESSDSIFQGR
ncbi:unnamed protein product [Microthlaspi erraticum]|uniref:non-specific serine/threonine protein kinase n=1 Tax=Microthlaspi erraticum TaxID=1685480 RepID=A0A6D2KAT7_9BRAS|nr:unnamed protein product [Microthlaspi erraticum]